MGEKIFKDRNDDAQKRRVAVPLGVWAKIFKDRNDDAQDRRVAVLLEV